LLFLVAALTACNVFKAPWTKSPEQVERENELLQCKATGEAVVQRMKTDTAAPALNMAGSWQCTVNNSEGEWWKVAQEGEQVTIVVRYDDGTSGSLSGQFNHTTFRTGHGLEVEVSESAIRGKISNATGCHSIVCAR
jgi:hypothetical protein